MAFRMPSHLESLVPAPQQHPSAPRWRGTLNIDRFGPTAGAPQPLYVTAAETDGECRFDLWPNVLGVHVTTTSASLEDVRTWVKQTGPVLCMVLPDRLADATVNAHNLAVFGTLSQLLSQNQMVGIVPWGAPDRLPGAGMILYPVPGSTALLTGAVFLASQFPEWAHLLQRQSPSRMHPSSRVASGSGPPPPPPPLQPPPQAYSYNPGAYGAVFNSPVTPQNPYGPPGTQLAANAVTQQQQYERYMLGGAAPSSASTSNSDGSWPTDISY